MRGALVVPAAAWAQYELLHEREEARRILLGSRRAGKEHVHVVGPQTEGSMCAWCLRARCRSATDFPG